MAKAQVTVPLDIPDVRVLKTEVNKAGELIITVESIKSGTRCWKCDGWIQKSHGHDDWVEVRHLPVFGRPSYLRFRPKRYYCKRCEVTTTQRLSWRENKSPHTMKYDDHVLLQMVNSTIEDVSIKEQLAYDRVLGVLERRIHAKVDWQQYTSLEVLGLDEIARRKGHNDFLTLATARLSGGRIVILAVLPDRRKDTVIDFLRSIPERLLKTIHTVCCDMYEGFTEAARKEVKTARIVIDRFHVTRHYRDAADRVRKQEQVRLKAELPKEEYKQLKGLLWAFRKSRKDLNPEERKVLKRFFKYSPDAKTAYDLREQLTKIFDQDISQSIAKRKIKAWIKRVNKSDLSCFNDFLNTLDRWWEDITNYFIDRANSGFVEGLNNKVKVLKRRCYGLYNLEHFFQRIFLDLEGYRLFAFYPPYVA
jgi:transposase